MFLSLSVDTTVLPVLLPSASPLSTPPPMFNPPALATLVSSPPVNALTTLPGKLVKNLPTRAPMSVLSGELNPILSPPTFTLSTLLSDLVNALSDLPSLNSLLPILYPGRKELPTLSAAGPNLFIVSRVSGVGPEPGPPLSADLNILNAWSGLPKGLPLLPAAKFLSLLPTCKASSPNSVFGFGFFLKV